MFSCYLGKLHVSCGGFNHIVQHCCGFTLTLEFVIVVPMAAALIGSSLCFPPAEAPEGLWLVHPLPTDSPPMSSCSVLMGHSVIFSIESTDVWAWLQHLLSAVVNPHFVCWLWEQTSLTPKCILWCGHTKKMFVFLFACVFTSMKVESFNKTGRSTSYLCCDLQGECFKDPQSEVMGVAWLSVRTREISC